MSPLTKTSSDHRRQGPLLLHHHQLTQWPLKQTLPRPPPPKHLLLQRPELRRKRPRREPRRQMYYKVYKERLEEQFQEELQEEEGVEEDQDPQVAELHPQPQMPPNSQHNLLKMSK